MSKKVDPKDLMKNGVHFGHKPSAWHPKMAPFIFSQKNGVHVIDLDQTTKMLEEAGDYVRKSVAGGGKVLFVGTKAQARGIIKKTAIDCDMPYVTERWLGGTLTNFKEINGLVKKLERLISQSKDADYELKYTKKERLVFAQEMKKLQINIGGISNMNKVPDVVFISSVRQEKTAVKEATSRKLPIVGVCDTNANPELVNVVIPANDDAVKSIAFIAEYVSNCVKEGQKELASKGPETPKQ